MKLRVLAFGSRMPEWVLTGCAEYSKRLPAAHTPEIIELPIAKRNSGKSLSQLIAEEDQRMLGALRQEDFVIALDQAGKSWSTEQLADNLANWQQNGQDLALLIGGPDGLGPECLARANLKWSLSKLTLPHPLVRIVLFEQLYRAWSIQQGHPYHK